jgi:hypothetical protein
VSSSYDPYVAQLADLFAENPIWVKAMQPVAEGAMSNVYFSHLPGCVWHLVKENGEISLREGKGENPDFASRPRPSMYWLRPKATVQTMSRCNSSH